MAVTRDTLVDLLAKHGGKMSKSDFVSEFRSLLESDDPAERRRRRDNFKALVNQVACVKEQNGVRNVTLKRVHRPLLNSRTAEEAENTVEDGGDGGGGEQQQLQSNGRLGAGGALPPAGPEEELQCIEEPGGPTVALSPVQQALQRSTFGEFQVRRTLMFSLQKPPKSSCVYSEPDDPLSPRSSMEAHSVGIHPDTNTDPPGSPTLSSRNSSSRRRPPPPPMSTENAASSEPGSDNRVLSAVPLEPAEHQWLVQCAAGHWNHVLGLLMQDSLMATKRDFTSGFTVLHWAAKCGDSHMLITILDMARRGGVDVDVDVRSHGGYTPLHVAVLHGQDYVVSILVGECSANVGARDNSGRRAYHYLRPGAAASLRKMLGQPRVPQRERIPQQERSEENELLPLEPSRGRLHSLSRLFQPHAVENKRKHKQRPSIASSTFTSHSEYTVLCPTEEEEEQQQRQLHGFGLPETQQPRC